VLLLGVYGPVAMPPPLLLLQLAAATAAGVSGCSFLQSGCCRLRWRVRVLLGVGFRVWEASLVLGFRVFAAGLVGVEVGRHCRGRLPANRPGEVPAAAATRLGLCALVVHS
jgi:hypothetical protein